MSRSSNYSTLPPNVFKFQQSLLTTSFAFPIFFFLGTLLLVTGVVNFVLQPGDSKYVIDYTFCKNSKGQICSEVLKNSQAGNTERCICEITTTNTKLISDASIYYRISGFYQNYRSFVSSYSDKQLQGNLHASLQYDCNGLYTLDRKNIFPCGFLPNSIFNDSIEFYQGQNKITLNYPKLLERGRFRNTENFNAETFEEFSKPPNWRGRIDQVYSQHGVQDFRFMTWMIPYPFNNVLKLVGVWPFDNFLGHTTQSYRIRIEYNYEVASFKGRKEVVIQEIGLFGVRNIILAVIYITSGLVSLIFAFLCFLHYRFYRHTFIVEHNPIDMLNSSQ